MADGYPYDETTRDRVAFLLYHALPLLYRVQDQSPQGTLELEKFLRVLAAPLAVAHQSVDELHANLFIDTCGDAALPLLAQIVGTDLVFPDADTNRRDLRGTISRRQRKGTRPMLQELGRDVTEQLIAIVEGWRRLVIVQDLNLQHPERPLPDVRPLTFGSSATGPLDAAYHLIDIRSITRTTGRYHPKDLTHWVSVTKLFPLQDGTPAYTMNPADPSTDPIVPPAVGTRREWRYAFDPSRSPWALRQRPANDDDLVTTDRILADQFAARPGDFFGKEGRFEIRVADLPAGVVNSSTEPRDPVPLLADLEIARGTPNIVLLEHPLHGWQNGVFTLSLCVVEHNASNVPIVTPPATAINVRTSISLGAGASTTPPPSPVSATGIVLLRLEATGRYFPGATVAISGGQPAAGRAANIGIASLGFLRGALAVTLPPTWVFGQRWFYLTADGSVYDAQTTVNVSVPDIAFLDPTGTGTPKLADPFGFRTLGPGAAWPPLPRDNTFEKLTTMPPPPGRGPNILHGGRVLDTTGAAVGAGVTSALVFAGRFFDAGTKHELIGRLRWTGSDPATARWELLHPDGTVVTTAVDAAIRLRDLVIFRNSGPNQLAIAARFECSLLNAVFTPSEVAWSSDDGDTLLLYLPERIANLASSPSWPSILANVSDVVALDDDGSSRVPDASLLRVSEGRVAPLRGPVLHTRRKVKWRQIPQTPAPPSSPPINLQFITDATALANAERCLDVDVEGGRFSFYGEAPQAWPLGPLDPPPTFFRPPNVTVAFQDGYTAHVGALPAPREVLLFQLTPVPVDTPPPTRLVSRSGTVSSSRDPSLYGSPAGTGSPPTPEVPAIPRYTTIRAALEAIQADINQAILNNLPPNPVEVIRIEDDATYPQESLPWPEFAVTPDPVFELTIMAADSRRPTIELVGAPTPDPDARYKLLTLRGIAFGGLPLSTTLELPQSEHVNIQFCTVTDITTTIVAPLLDGGTCSVLRSVTAQLSIVNGLLEARDSVIDAGTGETPGVAIASTGPSVTLDACTVVGGVAVPVLEASHCIFVDVVIVEDRFHGCVRFSAVASGSTLPRRHEVVEGLDARFLSLDRNHPGHVRLTEQTPVEISMGGEDGSELGAFGHLKSAQRLAGYQRRLAESTPAGLTWALIRVD